MNSDDVDTASWLRALADVESLNPKFIIPGHGKPSTAAKQAIAFTRDYIEYVRGAMIKAVENWIDFDAAYEVSLRRRPPGIDLDFRDSCLKSGSMIVSTI